MAMDPVQAKLSGSPQRLQRIFASWFSSQEISLCHLILNYSPTPRIFIPLLFYLTEEARHRCLISKTENAALIKDPFCFFIFRFFCSAALYVRIQYCSSHLGLLDSIWSLCTSCFWNLKQKRRMYPRVKVREQGQDDQFSPQNDRGSLLFLMTLESLSLQDEETQRNSPPSIPRIITRACVPKAKTEVFSTSKVKNKNTNISSKGTKLNGKGSPVPVPRPRAVLSSPENDGMIGDINKLLIDNERCNSKSALKKLGPALKTPAQNAARKAKGSLETAANRSERSSLKPPKAGKQVLKKDNRSSSVGVTSR